MQLWSAPVDSPARRTRLALPLVDEYDVRGDGSPMRSRSSPTSRCARCRSCAAQPPGCRREDGRTGWALADGALWLGYYGEPGELVRFDLARRAGHAAHCRTAHRRSAPISRSRPTSGTRSSPARSAPAIDLMLAPRPR